MKPAPSADGADGADGAARAGSSRIRTICDSTQAALLPAQSRRRSLAKQRRSSAHGSPLQAHRPGRPSALRLVGLGGEAFRWSL